MSCVSVSLMDMDREGQHALTDQLKLKGKSRVRDAPRIGERPGVAEDDLVDLVG